MKTKNKYTWNWKQFGSVMLHILIYAACFTILMLFFDWLKGINNVLWISSMVILCGGCVVWLSLKKKEPEKEASTTAINPDSEINEFTRRVLAYGIDKDLMLSVHPVYNGPSMGLFAVFDDNERFICDWIEPANKGSEEGVFNKIKSSIEDFLRVQNAAPNT
jgi:hypothetical protein